MITGSGIKKERTEGMDLTQVIEVTVVELVGELGIKVF